MKLCHKCNSFKPLDSFNKNKGKKDGLESCCRDCKRKCYQENKEHFIEKVKERYILKREEILIKKNEKYSINKTDILEDRKKKRRENPGVEALTQKKRFHLIRNQVINLLGNRCVSCGCSELQSLCIDHINDDGSEERKKGISSITLFRNILKNGIGGRYQCLCFNCNLRKEILKDRNHPLLNLTKKCPTCLNVLDLSSFKVHERETDGRYYECRLCHKFRNLVLKHEALESLGTSRCSCGIDDLLVLSVDHINEDGNNYRSDGLGTQLYRAILNRKIDISNLQVKCMNCNIKKHYKHKNYYHTVPNEAPIIEKCNPVLGYLELKDFSLYDVTISTLEDVSVPRAFLDSYHYSGYGRSAIVTYGVFLGQELLAVVKFTPPIRQGIALTLGVKNHELMELDRFCIHPARHKHNFASYIMKRVIRQVQSDFPQVLELVSFADPLAGHIGYIYKASNWTFCGKTKTSYNYMDGSGKTVNKKTLYQWAKNQGIKEVEYYKSLGFTKVNTPAKYKYHYKIR